MARSIASVTSRKLTFTFAVLTTAALAQLALLARCGHAGGTGTPQRDTVQSDATGYTTFVSSTRLSQYIDSSGNLTSLESIGFFDVQMVEFRKAYETALREGKESLPGSCLRMPDGGLPDYGVNLPLELEEWVFVTEVAFVGRVRSAADGWYHSGPAVLLTVDIGDLLHTASSDLEGISEMTVLLPAPALTVGGVTLKRCPSPWPAISAGEDLLFDFFHRSSGTPSYLEPLDVLTIRDGVIHNSGFSHVIVREGLTVEELSRAARQRRERRMQLSRKPR